MREAQKEVKQQGYKLPKYSPNTDIIEREDGFHLYMDLPGVAQEDLRVDVQDNELTIRARNNIAQLAEASHLHVEFGRGEYERSFTISDIVDQSNIKAVLKNGVLELIMPKAEKTKPKRIEIEAE